VSRARNPAFAWVGIAAVLIGLNVAAALSYYLAELLPVLLLGALCVAVWLARREIRHRPSSPRVVVGQVHDVTDAAQLRAENAELRARLAVAEESAHAAWDAASSVPPRPAPVSSDARDRLLTDRLGGVHDLWERP
jgi:hypothetical protein